MCAAHDQLSDIETRLVDMVTRGEVFDLAGDEQVDVPAMRSWGESRTVQADLIRKILRGQFASTTDHGLRLRGVRIAGRLDLENMTTAVWLELENCFLPEGIVARDAALPGLNVDSCLLEHPSEPPIDADRISIASYISLTGCTISAHAKEPAVSLSEARLGGNLSCSGAKLHSESGPALSADSLQVGSDIDLDEGFEAASGGETAVNLGNVRIGGRLNCSGGKLRSESGEALYADSLQVDRDVYLEEEFEAVSGGEGTAVNLANARIGGRLSCSGGKLRSESGPALYAEGLQVDRDVSLGVGFEAVSGGEGTAVYLANAHVRGGLVCSGGKLRSESGSAFYADGLQVDRDVYLEEEFEAVSGGDGTAVNLANAHIGGRVQCSGGKLRSESGSALYADGLQVDRDVHLGVGFEAVSGGEGTAVDLTNAHIGGRLQCSGGKVRSESGSALYADSLQVDRDVHLGVGFEAVSGGKDAAVYLTNAHIGGRLQCSGGKLRSTSGSAFYADGLQVDQDVFFREGFEAVGTSAMSVVRLVGARIAGDLDFSGGKIRNEPDPALNADTGAALDTDSSRVGRNFFLRDGFEAVGAGEFVVHLGEVRIGGVVEIDPTLVVNQQHGSPRFSLSGLTYSGIPLNLSSVDQWLDLLREDARSYTPQPYQQLAAAYRAAGQDSDVRKILMEQRRHQVRSRALTGSGARAWARLTGLTLGYGYQPWRALIGLLTVLILAVLLSVFAEDGALARTKESPIPGAACSTVERIGVGLDIGLPLIKTGTRARCDITATPVGQGLAIAGWVLQLLAWAFATLFIAGFTGAVRKT